MAARPRLLDLFCGAGGAAVGYHRAGFDVVGIDIKPQPRFPFEFIQADALEYCRERGHEFDAIHASPPCQAYSWAAARWKKAHPDLVADTRCQLQASGIPYVIENVVGAPLENAILLCGEMFGLGVIRHRLFESNLLLLQPSHQRHRGAVKDGAYVTVAGHGGESRDCTLAAWQRAMGIDWMSKQSLTQAIPPAYTEHIGRQLMAALQ